MLPSTVAGVMKKDYRLGRQSSRKIPSEVVSASVASTFILVLNWWLDQSMRLRPKEIDEVFPRLTLATLAVCE